MGIDGILNVAKPGGWTSHDVVARLRRVLRERRIGHAGTLDPMATGVLVVCVGQATRVVDCLMGAPKQYRATVLLGQTTATDDVTGETVATADTGAITRADVEAALARFVGVIQQRPPAFSALKVDGRPMYALARRGVAVEAAEREVHVYGLTLTEWQPPRFGLLIDCGRGTYVRSLARDVGSALGVGGCLATLERTRVGRFRLDDALTVDQIAALAQAGEVGRALGPIDTALADLPIAWVDSAGERRVSSGALAKALERPPWSFASDDSPPSTSAEHGGRRRVYSIDGRLIAIAELDRESGALQPSVTFRDLPATLVSPPREME